MAVQNTKGEYFDLKFVWSIQCLVLAKKPKIPKDNRLPQFSYLSCKTKATLHFLLWKQIGTLLALVIFGELEFLSLKKQEGWIGVFNPIKDEKAHN